MSDVTVKDTINDYPTITPYLCVNNAAKLIDFLVVSFDAAERGRQMRDTNNIMHAELKIGNSLLMISDPLEGYPPYNCNIYLYLNECDPYYHKAIAAGASSLEAPADQMYGHRRAGVRDAAGNNWYIASPLKK